MPFPKIDDKLTTPLNLVFYQIGKKSTQLNGLAGKNGFQKNLVSASSIVTNIFQL